MLKEARSARGGEVQCTQGFLAKEGVGGGGPASPERPDSLIDAACPARILAYPGPPRLEKDPGRVFFCDRFGIRYQDRKWMVDGLKDAYGTTCGVPKSETDPTQRGDKEKKESGPAQHYCTVPDRTYTDQCILFSQWQAFRIQGGTAVQGGVARQENVVCALAAAGKRGCEIC
ncbi:hypothetical protein MCOR29_006091 [Pyricularia oryzae]|uniref:Uncharacterized protein n=3 Tax=Pyricularia oryzae TaxID=318829 RepID=A0A4P7N8N3_PYROR|nr:hypothetical protein OOU_Y34scaffold00149g12 [Pyricularia oryzae Y34]KAH8847425.1 hypothetical protein MCOR01_000856 [Pyricularia oryzae]KAI6260004.1 hypothetical protein MCOR19_003725 [Pyricularia oryzae]KAI6318042.1 hypothetical protein MCOR29_006091 [Pyricularia oryzae]KAI6337200.1 hypothetical protein MCOR30_003493 [Pyricularia oryzae]